MSSRLSNNDLDRVEGFLRRLEEAPRGPVMMRLARVTGILLSEVRASRRAEAQRIAAIGSSSLLTQEPGEPYRLKVYTLSADEEPAS